MATELSPPDLQWLLQAARSLLLTPELAPAHALISRLLNELTGGDRAFILVGEPRRGMSALPPSDDAPAQPDTAVAVPRKAPGLSPASRRDSKTWLWEIYRLLTPGVVARADAELAEFKRPNRAYATSPDG